jgi:hypothetical protein
MTAAGSSQKRALQDLVKNIDDSIAKVQEIPIIQIGDFSSEQLKREIVPLLQSAKDRTTQINDIVERINGIRNEIINPVNEAIGRAARPSVWFGITGVGGTLIGIALTLYAGLQSGIERPIKPSSRAEATEPTASAGDEERLLALIELVTKKPTGHRARAAEIVARAENLILQSPPTLRKDLEPLRVALQEFLAELRDQKTSAPDLEAMVLYAFQLLDSWAERADGWESVKAMRDFGRSRSLLGTEYGRAILIYGAEADLKLRGTAQALLEYRALPSLGPSSLLIIGPGQQSRASVEELVRDRTAQLQLIEEQPRVWVFDSSPSSGRDQAIVTVLAGMGLHSAEARGALPGTLTFYQPYLYARSKADTDDLALKRLLAKLPELAGIKAQHYAFSDLRPIRDVFENHKEVGFVLVLQEKPIRPADQKR